MFHKPAQACLKTALPQQRQAPCQPVYLLFRSPDADAQIGDILFSCRRGPADKFVIGPAALRHIGKIHRHTFCKFRLIKLLPDLPEFFLTRFQDRYGVCLLYTSPSPRD